LSDLPHDITSNGTTIMADIYDQHRAAFDKVSAYVVLKDYERVATVAFKFPKDGAGRLWAYVHWLGTPMVRGFAIGGGYDKRTAACSAAVQKIAKDADATNAKGWAEFSAALWADAGPSWEDALRRAGFTVLQAV
jgi:hypothetical protein